jgi:uncharacterized protein with PQ loop repeat
MFKGLHHLHIRKRIHQQHEPYPHPDRLKNFMDHIIYIVGLAGPLMAVPQLFTVWIDKVTAGVSPATWGLLAVIACFWITYGVIHRARPIVMTYICWLVVNSMIAVGVLLN